MGFNDFKEAVQDGTTNKTNGGGGEYESHPLVKLMPETVLAFDEITDMWRSDTDYGTRIGVTVTNPNPVSDDELHSQPYMANGKEVGSVARTDDAVEEYHDYTVFNPEDEYFDAAYDQNQELKHVTGGHPSASNYYGHPVDGIEEDTVTLYFNGATGNAIGRALDRNGYLFADYDDETGEHTNGLIEVHPDVFDEEADASNLDERDRYARDPELRELDFEANGGGFFAFLWATPGKAYDITVGFNDFDGDNMQDATLITPQVDNSGFDEAELKWHAPPTENAFSEVEGDFSEVLAEVSKDTFDARPVEEQEVAHHAVVGLKLRPEQDPMDKVTDMDSWLQNIGQLYDGDRDVDEVFGEDMVGAAMEYADMVNGDFDNARENGLGNVMSGYPN